MHQHQNRSTPIIFKKSNVHGLSISIRLFKQNMNKQYDKIMSMQLQKSIFNLATTILSMGAYLIYVFGINGDINISKILEIQFWGSFTLTMTCVLVVAKIILFILFAIFKTIVNNHKNVEDLGFVDERDKLIETKSDQYSHWIAMVGFIVSMIPLSMGFGVQYMFLIILSFGFMATVMSDVWRIHFYSKES